jgi:hypothetical protein|tara:strand:+ start:2371 stop:2685 length:315 start_codon:yes stop_codon:yes gene_type:complete
MASKNETGYELIQLFEKLCDKHTKFFVPDPPRQDKIAESLVKHFDYNELELAIETFVRDSGGTVLVFDFAMRARDIIQKSKFEEQSRKKFRDIVEKTRQRMEES